MIAVLQRVKKARVIADGSLSGEIGAGLYILLGVEQGDEETDATLLADKISKLRVFSDENGKMNLSVNDISGEVLVVSNFTLNANYKHGNRPDYFASASPDLADKLYEYFKKEISQRVKPCKSGVFGAHMETDMVTDGPVTLILNSSVLRRKGS